MRATAQDRTMAMLVGVNVNRTIAATFIIGSALAPWAGFSLRPMWGGSISTSALSPASRPLRPPPGGIGSIPGAVLGALLLGWAESFASGYISSDYEDVFAFALLVLVLIIRPSGLLGRPGLQKV
jgi:branched-chain amino acid transport system permease protein